MKRKLIIGVVVLVVIILFLSLLEEKNTKQPISNDFQPTPIQTSEVTKKGNRTIALDVGEGADMDYDDAFKLAQKAGLERIGLFLAWFILEPSPGKFDGAWLDVANSYYPNKNTPLDLTIAVYNANQKVVASDLKSRPINAPEVVGRFKKLLDFVFSKTQKLELASINIGSEGDISFGGDTKQWDEFSDFYRQVTLYIHEKKPGVPVTAEFTFVGLSGGNAKRAKDVNQYSDQIAISYYGMRSDGYVAKPTQVHADFAKMVSLYPNKQILLLQFGYPSSEYLHSSYEKQATFIHEAFLAWDKHANAIQLIDFTWLHDLSPEVLKETVDFYGISGKKFSEYLGSLGLRTYAGQDKPAFLQLQAEVSARGWGN